MSWSRPAARLSSGEAVCGEALMELLVLSEEQIIAVVKQRTRMASRQYFVRCKAKTMPGGSKRCHAENTSCGVSAQIEGWIGAT